MFIFVGTEIVPETGFSVTQGEPVSYHSSAQGIREFCGQCGTALTYRNEGYADQRFQADSLVAITMVSLDDKEAFTPSELFHDDELPTWLTAENLCPGALRHHPADPSW